MYSTSSLANAISSLPWPFQRLYAQTNPKYQLVHAFCVNAYIIITVRTMILPFPDVNFYNLTGVHRIVGYPIRAYLYFD